MQASAPTTSFRLSFANPPGLYDPRPNGYSHLAMVQGPARLVYAAGQGGEDTQGYLAPDFPTQVRQALANLRTALAAAGARPQDVVKLTVLIVDHTQDRLRIFSEQIQALWADAPTPACTLIPVPRLALDGMLFEIEATAAVAA